MSPDNSDKFKRSYAWTCFTNYLCTMEAEIPIAWTRLNRVQNMYNLFMEDPSHCDRKNNPWYTNKQLELDWAKEMLERADQDVKVVSTRFPRARIDSTTRAVHDPEKIPEWQKLKDARMDLRRAQRYIESVEHSASPHVLKGWCWY